MTPDKQTPCDRCEDLLDDYRQGRLPTEERKQLEDHLEHCDVCKAELLFRNELVTHLRNSMPTGPTPVGLSPAVHAAIQMPKHKLSQNSRKMVLIPWMFAAAVLVIFAVAFYNNRLTQSFDYDNIVAVQVMRGPTIHSEEKADKKSARKESPSEMMDIGRSADPDNGLKQETVMPSAPQPENAVNSVKDDNQLFETSRAGGMTLRSLDKNIPTQSAALPTTTTLNSDTFTTTESLRETTATQQPAQQTWLPVTENK